jgi:hypothetical protein
LNDEESADEESADEESAGKEKHADYVISCDNRTSNLIRWLAYAR